MKSATATNTGFHHYFPDLGRLFLCFHDLSKRDKCKLSKLLEKTNQNPSERFRL